MEPVGPGSSTRKAKVAGGATGVASHVPEYKLTLAVSKKLQKELKARGYKVYMIRTKNNVNISNKKRAQLANKSGADIYIRIHADSSNSRAVTGASGLYPSKANRYVSKLSAKSKNYLHVCSSLIVKKQRYATEVWLQEMTLQEQTGARYRFLLLKWDF
ncbi:MAG: N-acetylmuramoyl-L-alanine amidase [Butyribacter sp.]